MKRIFTAILALILVLGLSQTAFADMIYEPRDNFIQSHQEDCRSTYYWHRYKASGDANVPVQYMPEDDEVIAMLAPDEVFSSNTTYTAPDGTIWYYYGSASMDAGWVSGDYVTRLYDSDLFLENYARDIVHSQETLNVYELEQIVFYYYPNGEQMAVQPLTFAKSDASPEEAVISFDTLYKDDAGRIWGYVGYFYGPQNAWICISEPTLEYEALKAQAGVPVEDPAAAYAEGRSSNDPADPNAPDQEDLQETAAASDTMDHSESAADEGTDTDDLVIIDEADDIMTIEAFDAEAEKEAEKAADGNKSQEQILTIGAMEAPKPNYTPWIIGGAVLVVALISGGILFFMKKKKD